MTDLATGGTADAAIAVESGPLQSEIWIAQALRVVFAAAPTGLRPGACAGEIA